MIINVNKKQKTKAFTRTQDVCGLRNDLRMLISRKTNGATCSLRQESPELNHENVKINSENLDSPKQIL